MVKHSTNSTFSIEDKVLRIKDYMLILNIT